MNEPEAVKILEDAGYIAVRPLERNLEQSFGGDDKRFSAHVAVLDTETTSEDPEKGKIIDLAVVLVSFDPKTLELGRIVDHFEGLEDPGHPLEQVTIDITGLTDEDVRGKRFDDAAFEKLMSRASLVVAHNANFDRQFMEKRFGSMIKKWWACSMADVDWKAMGVESIKLDYLAFKVGRFHYKGHRAMIDALATLNVLGSRVESGEQAFTLMANNAKNPSYTLWATGAPFEVKDALKAAGYRWNGEAVGTSLKAWHKAGLSQESLDEELEFLKGLYPRGAVTVDKHNGWTRYSGRLAEGARDIVKLSASAPKP